MSWPTVSGIVLVPFDFSEAAGDALRVASSFAESPDNMLALYVVAPLPPMAQGVVWNTFNETDAATRAKKTLREVLDENGMKRAEGLVAIGDPAQVILDTAAERSTDLIVIPTHGRTGLRRFLIGSVAGRVVPHAPCPVLVLRTEGTAAT